jgi:hypothetical protein
MFFRRLDHGSRYVVRCHTYDNEFILGRIIFLSIDLDIENRFELFLK